MSADQGAGGRGLRTFASSPGNYTVSLSWGLLDEQPADNAAAGTREQPIAGGSSRRSHITARCEVAGIKQAHAAGLSGPIKQAQAAVPPPSK